MSSLIRIIAITRHELRVLFYSPLTYLFQSGFLLVLGLCVFQVADFYSTDETSLRLWLLFMPWVGLVFAPALAMNALPDGEADRSMELCLTLPVTAMELVCGKYLAGIAVLAVTLVCSLVFLATLAYLGEPDWGVVVAGLLASFLLLAAYFAVAVSVASLLGNAMPVFVTSVVALFTLLLFGKSEMEPLFDAALAEGVLRAFHALSPLPYFESIASGLIRLSDVCYFLLFIIILLLFCQAAVTARRYGRMRYFLTLKFFLIATGMLTGAVLLQAMLKESPLESDWTEQREFTLSEVTVSKIRQIQGDVQIDFFWSEQQPNVPAAIRAHAERVLNFLMRIKYHSQGGVVVRQFDPVPDTDMELRAIKTGIRSLPMTSGEYFYLGLAMRYGERTHRIPYIDRERERFLEYDLLSALIRLIEPKVVRVALISPLLPPTALSNPRPGLSFVEELKRRNNVALVPFFAEQLPKTGEVDVVIVLQGTVLKRAMLYAIDQHVMRGGALIALLDPEVRSDKASNETRFVPSENIDDLSDLLLSYGVRYAGEHVVGDAQLAAAVSLNDGESKVSYPYWMRFDKSDISADHPVMGGLSDVLLVEAGALEIINHNVARSLLRTTDDSGIYPRDEYHSRDVRKMASDFKGDGDERVVAALIEGELNSAYAQHDFAASQPGHLSASMAARVFVVADSDWLFDTFAFHTTVLADEVITRPVNDNFALLENMIVYGAGAELSGIPTRARLSRPFTRVTQLFKHSELAAKTSERSIFENMDVLEKNLTEIRKVSGIEDFSELPSPLREQALAVQEKLVVMRRDIRNIRLQIREQIDRLGQRLALLNIAGGPLLVLALGVAVWLVRRRRLCNWRKHTGKARIKLTAISTGR